jgi:hypothetical protein
MRFLDTVVGRAVFYVFIGTLAICKVSEPSIVDSRCLCTPDDLVLHTKGVHHSGEGQCESCCNRKFES